MPDISATEASRNFSRLLDTVEHDGTTYVIVRHGAPVAQLSPVARCSGARLKSLFREHVPDPRWREDLDSMRDLLEDQPRRT
ncbi:MAG TPA: type II toxin-antitoxin system prevent-host-death family antitoxin [Nitriliruptorales bacterium]|nr:type II toxin-antitoxin system prevent-host-death family antitoxin [Nitriliruptorales bacterium]